MNHKYQLSIGVLLLLLSAACTKIDNSYKDFVVPGGRVYVEKPRNAAAYAGYHKVQIAWVKASDPNVSGAKIYWNNYADSVMITVNPQQDTVRTVINGLLEQYYTFVIQTFDKNGNTSVPVEITGRSIGDTYLSGLSQRFLQSAFYRSGTFNAKWGAAAVYNGAVGVKIFYTDVAGKAKEKFVPNDETNTIISDYSDTTGFRYTTLYKADTSAIDTIYTPMSAIADIKMDKSLWKVVAFSTQHPGADNAATNLIDGTFTTRWHTLASGSSYPHFIVVDMGSMITISKFSVERTNKDAPNGDERGPDKFQLLVSNDNTSWTDLGVFNFNRFVDGEQMYNIANAPKSRYFKFVGLSGPQAYMVLGEVSVYGF
ncbi:DUF4998 domain-containing protein [Niabella drilacis]|uniref:F5/8 type C domain-containing protein n=1 Tax=Niabella drilacis (strain DSM 25811 / CCM 8410 / CCUG 62505 / LMG 26954 / E90) TaxID=1285928 RepID=A0A1G6L161_NIADE|nr:DUF4998 domain-containing protein [Niabella drilacis]SDC37109.1 F5/8 type C domain-containing protein [Niabella drilacis]